LGTSWAATGAEFSSTANKIEAQTAQTSFIVMLLHVHFTVKPAKLDSKRRPTE